MALFDGWDWGGIAKAAVPAVLGAFGMSETKDANQRAAGFAQSNQTQNLAEVRAAKERAVGYLKPVMADSAPASEYFRQVMAKDPYQLSPAQRIALDDTRMSANRTLPTALRGSGRAVSATLNDTVNRAQARMIGDNQSRADNAAGRLKSSGDSATSTAANVEIGSGRDVVNINNAGSDAAANAELGTASANNDTLGAITAIFANANKNEGRKSEYGGTGKTGGA